MKTKCRHSWQFTGKEPHGEDRVISTWTCSRCGKTRTRNLKKPRFVPYAELLDKKASKSRKQVKMQQNPRKQLKKRSDKRKAWSSLYEQQKSLEKSMVPVWGIGATKSLLPPSMTERHHPLGRIGCRIIFYRHVTPAMHQWIHHNAAEARHLGYILPEMSGRESAADQPDPFNILPEYQKYVGEHGLH
jgi:hypothetical protein